MVTPTMDVLNLTSVNDRVRRLGWLALWLLAKHSLSLWLTVPPSTAAATQRHDG